MKFTQVCEICQWVHPLERQKIFQSCGNFASREIKASNVVARFINVLKNSPQDKEMDCGFLITFYCIQTMFTLGHN